jgi:hypothetical protein
MSARRTRLRLVLLAAASFSSLSACNAESTLKGRDFVIPIPAGWTRRGPVEPPAGQFAIWQKERTAPDAFLGSIVVVPIPPTTPPLDVASLKDCKAVGNELAGTEAKVTKAGIIDGTFGKTCQIALDAGRQHALFTLVHGPSSNYGVTCNHAPDDKTALDACQRVLTEWKFTPRS